MRPLLVAVMTFLVCETMLFGLRAINGAEPCAITAVFHQTPTGRQITVDGSGFAANDQVTIGGLTGNGAAIDVELAANDQGNFEVELDGTSSGQYIIGPATGLSCTAPPITLTAHAITPAPTVAPSAVPSSTVPPTPHITLPPTDTE